MKRHYSLSPADRAVAGSGSAVLADYMALRLRYVTGMGWLHGIRSDHDVYDGLADTRYFVRLDRRPAAVSAGMRATRVASLYDSLTWRMLGTTPGTQQAITAANELLLARLGRCAADESRGLWDITRLVAPLNGPVSKAEIVRGIYELVGMALHTTAIEPQTDPVWVLLTTRSVKRLFDMSGMEYTTVFCGRVTPTDDYDCYLCVVRPRSLSALLSQSLPGPARRRALDGVAAGFDAMRGQARRPPTRRRPDARPAATLDRPASALPPTVQIGAGTTAGSPPVLSVAEGLPSVRVRVTAGGVGRQMVSSSMGQGV